MVNRNWLKVKSNLLGVFSYGHALNHVRFRAALYPTWYRADTFLRERKVENGKMEVATGRWAHGQTE